MASIPGAPGIQRRRCGMAEVVPFLIPIAVFFVIGIVAQMAVLRESKRLDRQRGDTRE